MRQDIKLKGKLKGYTQTPLQLTLLFAAMDVWMYVLNVKAGILGTIFVAIYFFVMLFVYWRNQPILLNELIDFATQYGTVQKRLLNEFEVPYAVMDSAGKMLWMNHQFELLSEKDKGYHKSITTIFPQITRELMEKEDELELTVQREEKVYRASVHKIHFADILHESSSIELTEKQQYLQVIYLFDETLLTQYRIENQEMQMVSALVYIDNYDEVLDTVEEVKQSLLVALVDRKVNKFFASIDGLVKKTEKDKYFVVFRHKYLEKMEEEKFSLLEDVKSIKVGNEMSVTLSMGTLCHRGRELLCGCIPLRPGGRRRDRQHRQAAGRSVHLPQGRHRVCARRPLPHRQPVPEEQHHPVSGKGCRAAGRQRPHPLPHPARRTAQRERGGRVLPDRLGGQPAEQLCRPAEHHPGARRRGHR